MFEIKNLSKQYGTEFALQNVTMSIGKGINFIVGASGSGKTTLLKILSGMEGGFSGSVTYAGQDITGFHSRERSALYHSVFGFVWQDFHLIEEATVLDNILLPQYLSAGKGTEEAQRIINQLKLSDVSRQKVKNLSGGQKQRVAIARELMKNPQVIFCDEPTSALDGRTARSIMEILRTLSENRTVIVVTHDTSLIRAKDTVFELDKGELVAGPDAQTEQGAPWKSLKKPRLNVIRAFRVACKNIRNRAGRFAVGALSLVIAGVLLLTATNGTVGQKGQSEFDKLVETYGDGILDIGLVGSFTNAAGGDEDRPDGSVNQDLDGLYETYQNDERVEFIVSMQPFENIKVTLDGETYNVEQTGNSPVLTKLLSGDIPQGKEYQVVIPLKLAESIGLTPESALGKKIDFSATVYQWIDNQPIEKPVQLQATVCGVADNTVVYDYEGQTYSFTVDDSFFFNMAAIEEIRKQAGITDTSANFTIRAKTPEALISLKDELNQKGIVPLGWFELVEDIVRLNQQTAEQSGSASMIIAILAVLLVVVIFVMTSVLRKREYAIYKVCGYSKGHLAGVLAAEAVCTAAAGSILMLVTSPLLNMAMTAMFDASILSAEQLAIGVLMILAVSFAAFVAELPAAIAASVSDMLKAGDKS